MLVKIRQGEFDTDKMNRLELMELRNTVQESVASMVSQLEETKLKVTVNHEYADPNWFRKLTYACKTYRRYDQMLSQIISMRRREENIRFSQERSRSFDEAFYEVCKEHLNTSLFEQMVSLAKIKSEQDNGG